MSPEFNHHEMYARGGTAVVVDSGSSLPSTEQKYRSTSARASTPIARALWHNSTSESNTNSTSVSPTSPQQNNQHHNHVTSLQAVYGIAVAALILIMVFCLLMAPCYAQSRRRRRRHRNTAMQRAAVAARQEQGGAVTSSVRNKILQQSPEERYANIEAWLVSKTVTEHDAVCDRVCATKTSSRLSRSLSRLGDDNNMTSSTITNHTATFVGTETLAKNENKNQNTSAYSECPICFDTIEPGDVVSWSPQPACGHVFHHECIKEWLMKNHNCPYCRQTCLPIDFAAETSKKQIRELIVARRQRDIPCFYCAQHGVVRPPGHLLLAQKSTKITARPNGVNDENNDTPVNGNNLQCEDDEEADFYETLHARSHEIYCRTALKRLRGNTIGSDDDELTADLENQAALSSSDDEDHRETFRELP